MTERRKGREAGAVAAVLVLCAILYTLFASPQVSITSDGTYVNAMEQLHITWAGDPVAAGAVAQTFAYDRFDASSLLKTGQMAILYPGAVVRLLTQPFGLPFDTRLLACVYALMIALGTYLAVSGLYPRSHSAAIAVSIVLVLTMMNSTVNGYLNSLYPMGTALACLMLFIGCVVHSLCSDRGMGAWQVLKVLVSGVLLLQSQPQMIVMLPAVAICAALSIWHAWPEKSARPLFCAITVASLAICGASVAENFQNQKDVQSDAANHLAVFQGYLMVSDKPEQVLEGLGLEADYLRDVGRSYYEDASLFAHDPRTDEKLQDAIRLENRVAYCLQHPELVVRLLQDKNNHYLDALNGRVVYEGWTDRYVRPSPYVLLKLLFGEGGLEATTWRMLGAALVFLALAAACKQGLRKLCAAMSALCGCSAMYLPCAMVLTGGLDVSMTKVMFFFFGWLSLLGGLAALVLLGKRLFACLASREVPLALTWGRMGDTVPFYARLDNIRISRSAMVWLCAVLAVTICCWILLPAQHIGGVNNGDFGRMMEQIDLYWTKELLDNSSDQLASRVVEEYDYREPFHPQRLTSADPTYSLIFPSMLVRLWSLLTNSPYSTLVQAWILLALTIFAVLLLVHDLYPLLGRATLLAGIALVIMLFGENYVAWYNSLLGESTICTSLMLMLGCAVHLMVMQRSGKRHMLWLVMLAVSVRMLTCSKAQMLLSLPSGLVLMVVLSVYHRPRGERTATGKADRLPMWMRTVCYTLVMMLLCVYVVWDSIGVYKKNDEVSSKQTVWQSVFFGALMVTDDVDAAMADLGLDPVLKADIGKHAYHPDEEYVWPVLSEQVEKAVYSKINAVTMVGYYLRHPKDLLVMLDHAAQESQTLHTGFMAYTGERYAESEGLYRFNVWQMIRPLTACSAFWQYVLLYGGALIWCIRLMCRKDRPIQQKLLSILFVCVMCIGAFQYPLTVIGNGFADNNKQLFTFMLCHDLMVITGVTVCLRALLRHALRPGRKTMNERREA
ncbi:MAG: hypothetical protein PUC00_02505 [Clostridiales bacterium]|nr:hypothetical protein [Clostridiales bacterium]